MEDYPICENCGDPIVGKPVWIREADGTPMRICEDCANPELGLTPQEIDDLIAFEAEMREREERKFELLYRLEGLRADDPLWDEIAGRLGVK